MHLALVDRWNRPLTAEVSISRDTVDVRCGDLPVVVADRVTLRLWLTRPSGTLSYGYLHWMAAAGGIALSIDEIVPCWWLTDDDVDRLRERV